MRQISGQPFVPIALATLALLGVPSTSLAAPPPAATLVAPSGTVSTATPPYTWNAVTGATWYYLWVNDSTGTKITQWYRATDTGCGAGTGACSVTPSTALAAGAATWWIQTYSPGLYGPWSAAMTFTVMGPPAATLVSPSGTVSTATPTYTWNAIAGVTWYYLWVNDSAGNTKITQWYRASEAGCAAGTGTCSVTPSTALAAGAATWWIQTYSPGLHGPWSAAVTFTVMGPPAATLVSPSGTVSTATPTYTWNATANANWYQLWVNDSAGNTRLNHWYRACAVCKGTGTCSITPGTPLAGTAKWWVQTYGQGQYGPWSSAATFTAPPGEPVDPASFQWGSVQEQTYSVLLPTSEWKITITGPNLLDALAFEADSQSGERVFLLVPQLPNQVQAFLAPRDIVRQLYVEFLNPTTSSSNVQGIEVVCDSQDIDPATLIPNVNLSQLLPGIEIALVHYRYTLLSTSTVPMEGAALIFSIPGPLVWTVVAIGAEGPPRLFLRHVGRYLAILSTLKFNPQYLQQLGIAPLQLQGLLSAQLKQPVENTSFSDQELEKSWQGVYDALGGTATFENPLDPSYSGQLSVTALQPNATYYSCNGSQPIPNTNPADVSGFGCEPLVPIQ